MPVIDLNALIQNRVTAIRALHQATGVARAQIDVSGGVDSAVISSLLSRALGPEKVTAVFTDIDSSRDTRERASRLAAATGLRLVIDDLTLEFKARVAHMVSNLVEAGYDRAEIETRLSADPTILGSIRSTLRAPIGRGYNRLTGGGIRHGTGNECEDRFLRFFQKGGDGEVDTNPINMLSKGGVFQLARALDVPASILEATPSPDLWGMGDDHDDEGELLRWTGVAWTYSRVDPKTGKYTRIGTIERVNRYLDSIDDRLFREPHRPVVDFVDANEESCRATGHPAFNGLDRDRVLSLLASARKIEAATRHKMNPNAAGPGTRVELLEAGILTNELLHLVI